MELLSLRKAIFIGGLFSLSSALLTWIISLVEDLIRFEESMYIRTTEDILNNIHGEPWYKIRGFHETLLNDYEEWLERQEGKSDKSLRALKMNIKLNNEGMSETLKNFIESRR